MDQFTEWARELQAIAQNGLEYGHDVFDRERYQRLREIALAMMAAKTGIPTKKLASLFCGDEGYQTPKLDTRAAIIKDQQILLVHEKLSDDWSLPGGWCEYNLTTAQNCVKESREEAGHQVKPLKLVALLDRNHHHQPQRATQITKAFYLCQDLGGDLQANIETDQARYFSCSALPKLSEERNTVEEIDLCFQAAADPHWQTVFD